MLFEFKGRWYRRLSAIVPDHPGFGIARKRIVSCGVLSVRAVALYRRLLAGYYYRPNLENCPKAMQELIDNSLVTTAARVVTIERCFVPAHGYKSYEPESFDE